MGHWSIISWYKGHFEIQYSWKEDCSNESNGHYIEGDSDLSPLYYEKDSRYSFREAISISQDLYGLKFIVPFYIAQFIGFLNLKLFKLSEV